MIFVYFSYHKYNAKIVKFKTILNLNPDLKVQKNPTKSILLFRYTFNEGCCTKGDALFSMIS